MYDQSHADCCRAILENAPAALTVKSLSPYIQVN